LFFRVPCNADVTVRVGVNPRGSAARLENVWARSRRRLSISPLGASPMNRPNRLVALGVSLTCVAVGVALIVATTSAARTLPPATLAAVGTTGAQPPREEQWKKGEEAVNKGRPKTAIQLLEPIIESAMKDKAYPEAIKAVAKKIALEGNIEGNKPEEKITRMKAAINTAPPEMHPAMHAVLAHWYWHYFQQNRWRFVQRTSSGLASGDDITTWDLPRILAEIDAEFDKALANEKELKLIPIEKYAALLEKGTIPDSYRPTLWDFLAFDALGFYAAGEQAGARAEDHFEILVESPVFAPVAEFIAWNPETTDAKSPTLKGVRLLQKLLATHQTDGYKSAFLDTDLHRLRFGYNKALGEGKDERYIAALTAFAEQNKDHELSAMARFQWATVLQHQNELVKAR